MINIRFGQLLGRVRDQESMGIRGRITYFIVMLHLSPMANGETFSRIMLLGRVRGLLKNVSKQQNGCQQPK